MLKMINKDRSSDSDLLIIAIYIYKTDLHTFSFYINMLPHFSDTISTGLAVTCSLTQEETRQSLL